MNIICLSRIKALALSSLSEHELRSAGSGMSDKITAVRGSIIDILAEETSESCSVSRVLSETGDNICIPSIKQCLMVGTGHPAFDEVQDVIIELPERPA